MKQRRSAPTTPSASSSMQAPAEAGTDNSFLLEQMRDPVPLPVRNHTRKPQDPGWDEILRWSLLPPAAVDQLQQFRRSSKDGVDHSWSEKCALVVRFCEAAGASAKDLRQIAQQFFEYEPPGSGADEVLTPVCTGGTVVLAFSSGTAQVNDLVLTPPAVFVGLDTVERGAMVDEWSVSSNNLPGTWLEGRMRSPEIQAAFSTWAADRTRDNGVDDYIKHLKFAYTTRASAVVRAAVTALPTATNAQKAQAAINAAMTYTDPTIFLTAPRTTPQVQDEAVAQQVMAELGITLDVDTDNPGASVVTP